VSGPSTVREALIAEAIGEVAHLLDRAEALERAMAESRRDILNAHTQLSQELAQLTAVTEHAKVQAVKHILARTDEVARRSVDVQTRAMSAAASALFKSEVEPATQRLAARLEQLAHRIHHRWESWLVLAATAVVSSALTWAVAAWAWTR
jgi:hypothetical protein